MLPDIEHLPLDEQIYHAHTEWNDRTYDYDRLESMRKALHAHKIMEGMDGKKSVSRVTLEVEASEWSISYLKERDEAKRFAADAKAKYEYLCNLSKSQREESYHERFAAKL